MGTKVLLRFSTCVCVCVCLSVCVCVSVSLCVYMCVWVCVRVCVWNLRKEAWAVWFSRRFPVRKSPLFLKGFWSVAFSHEMDLDHKTHKCSIISDTIQPMSIKYAVKILRLKVYVIFLQSGDLNLQSRSQLRLKLGKKMFNLYYNSHYLGQYLRYDIQTWHDGRLMNGIIYAHARSFRWPDFDARSQCVGRG